MFCTTYLKCSVTMGAGHAAKLLGIVRSLVLLQLVLGRADLTTPEPDIRYKILVVYWYSAHI